MINKPINASPVNSCVNANDVLQIKYEIPNNEKIDGSCVVISDLETGELLGSNFQNYDEPTNKVSWNADDIALESKEYSWNSYYWQTPTKDPEIYTISNFDNSTNKLYLSTTSDIVGEESKSTILKDYYDGNNEYKGKGFIHFLYREEYNPDIGDYIWEDDPLVEYDGDRQEYMGGILFYVPDDDYYEVNGHHFVDYAARYGDGKCVMEIYNDNNEIIAHTRILAIDTLSDGSVSYADTRFDSMRHTFIAEGNFWSQINNAVKAGRATLLNSEEDGHYMTKALDCSRVVLYSSDTLNKELNITGLVKHNDNYYLAMKSNFIEYNYEITVYPHLGADVQFCDEVKVWNRNSAEFNTSPSHYFRVKPPPTVNVQGAPALSLSPVDGVNYISDIRHKFKLSYTSEYSRLNYFYLYLYALNPQTNEWVLKERSPMLYNPDDAYEFSGFINGQKYKIYGVCADSDGDEWGTAEVQFDVRYLPERCPDSSAFNKELTTIDISFDHVLSTFSTYPEISLDVYKVLKSDSGFVSSIDYVGGGMAKINNIICFDMLRDYNIRNNSYYDYYVRVVAKRENEEFVSFYLLSENVHTDFSGTSILGIEKISDTQLNIAKSFNLIYHFNKDIGELTNEMSREYINSFSKYPKELKGHQNYISGNCSGLLGSECNGIYEEPKGIRDSWKDFVNDDTIKFYRGIDGETMIISIESSKITPSYFPGVGIVNEVYITFKELSPTNQYAVFSTGKTGD